MNVTFGICLSIDINQVYINKLIKSIHSQKWEDNNYEIILIGGSDPTPLIDNFTNYRYIPFDESIKSGWITRKKNLIAQNATYENLVIMHDYYMLGPTWYEGLKRFGNDWDIMVHRMFNLEGKRHSDWMVHADYMRMMIEKYPGTSKDLMDVAPHENAPIYVCGLPYDVADLTKLQYVNGAYFSCKKHVLINTPQNENLVWGNPEDLEWATRLMQNDYKMRFNSYSYSTSQKPNKWHMYEMPFHLVDRLRTLI